MQTYPYTYAIDVIFFGFQKTSECLLIYIFLRSFTVLCALFFVLLMVALLENPVPWKADANEEINE